MAGGDDTLKGSTQMWNYLEEGLLECGYRRSRRSGTRA